MNKRIVGLGILLVFMYAVPSFAKTAFLKSFKETYPKAVAISKCKVCHEMAAPKLNYYGMDYQKNNSDFKVIEPFDSDGDGVSNIDEINQETFPGEKN